MQTPSFQVYTVFGSDGFWNNNCPKSGGETVGASLERLIELSVEKYEMIPVAWAAEGTTGYHGTKEYTVLRAESIAAGRLIEKTPSGWVALGAEKQEESEQAFRDALARDAADDMHIQSELRKGEPTSADLAMVARDGPKTTPRHLVKAILQDLATPLSTAKPNPFPTTLRSPDCESGPSDHLNASRHQMAGMRKS